MKKAINKLRRFMSNSFNWPEEYDIEFIKDIIGGFVLASILLLLIYISAVMG